MNEERDKVDPKKLLKYFKGWEMAGEYIISLGTLCILFSILGFAKGRYDAGWFLVGIGFFGVILGCFIVK